MCLFGFDLVQESRTDDYVEKRILLLFEDVLIVSGHKGTANWRFPYAIYSSSFATETNLPNVPIYIAGIAIF